MPGSPLISACVCLLHIVCVSQRLLGNRFVSESVSSIYACVCVCVCVCAYVSVSVFSGLEWANGKVLGCFSVPDWELGWKEEGKGCVCVCVCVCVCEIGRAHVCTSL